MSSPCVRWGRHRALLFPLARPGARFDLASICHVCLALLLGACGHEGPTSVIDPIYEDPCRFFPEDGCSHNGECHGDARGEPQCLCQLGFEGSACEICEAGFHLDSQARCVSDRGCAQEASDPCGTYGTCVDVSGVLACECKKGYGGPRCTLCAKGYARSPGGSCKVDLRGPSASSSHGARGEDKENAEPGGGDNAGGGNGDGQTLDSGTVSESDARRVCTSEQTTGLSFDGLSGFPGLDNLCSAAAQLVLPELTAQSQVGSSSAHVWLCAKNTISKTGFSSQHIALEAAPTQTAEISFPYDVSSVRFDYGAPESALSLEVLVRGASVQTIELARYGKGSLSLQFERPTTTFALRSKNLYRQNIAIDNLEFKYARCQ